MNDFERRLWRIARPFTFRRWPDGAVVFDKASGDTHSLTLSALRILTRIEARPQTLATLSASFADTPPTLPEYANPDTIERIVHDLHTLGLIEPAKNC